MRRACSEACAGAAVHITLREIESRLDVTQFDFARYVDVEMEPQAHGIEIITLTELRQRDSDWKEHWWELTNELLLDVPSHGGFSTASFEKFEQEIAVPFIQPDGVFFALTATELVGLTYLQTKDHAPEIARKFTDRGSAPLSAAWGGNRTQSTRDSLCAGLWRNHNYDDQRRK